MYENLLFGDCNTFFVMKIVYNWITIIGLGKSLRGYANQLARSNLNCQFFATYFECKEEYCRELTGWSNCGPVLWSMDLTICQIFCHLYAYTVHFLFYGIITCTNRKCADTESQEMLPKTWSHGVNLINMVTCCSLIM